MGRSRLASRLWLIVPLCVLVAFTLNATAKGPGRTPLVVISIDGLRPDYVLEADRYGLRIPELHRLLSEGAHASSVRGVLPTVTYPSHTTLVTGVAPAVHGILANAPFDPQEKNREGWYWYAEDIKVKTLWDAAADAGLVTANVDWPVTVGARITWNIAQIWRANTPDDAKLSRALSTPGLLAEVERALGPWAAGQAWNVDGDRQRAHFDRYILENKKPDLHLAYLTSLDEDEHDHGPGSPQALATLEAIDGFVGEIRAAAEKRAGGRVYIAVVSDHGFVRTERELELNEALRDAGLLWLDARGRVTSWRACVWNSGGSAAIMLKDPKDEDTRRQVAAILERLAADPANGIERILTGAEARAAGGFPDAAFVVGVRSDRRIGGKLEEPVLDPSILYHGDHGFLPDNKDMDATFLVVGPGIPAGRDLGRIDMRDVAPTLAGLLRLTLPAAEGHDLLGASGTRPAASAK
jgi:predicted AlkP superfamily pyrophosphatase or phosphodiesterase